MNKKTMILVILLIVGVAAFQYNKNQNESAYQKYLHLARLTEGIDAMLMMKMVIREYYDDSGKLPSSNAEVKLGTPEDYANQSLRSAQILPGGIIKLVFKVNTGVDGGILRYTPTVVPGMIKWSCETPDYPKMINLKCTYIGSKQSDKS